MPAPQRHEFRRLQYLSHAKEYQHVEPGIVGLQHQIDVIEFLWASMALFADGTDEADTIPIYRPRWADFYSLSDARDRILRLLAEAPEGALLGRLLPDMSSEDAITIPAELRRRSAWTSTFLASLELAKQGDAELAQEGVFAPIRVRRAGALAHVVKETSIADSELPFADGDQSQSLTWSRSSRCRRPAGWE